MSLLANPNGNRTVTGRYPNGSLVSHVVTCLMKVITWSRENVGLGDAPQIT